MDGFYSSLSKETNDLVLDLDKEEKIQLEAKYNKADKLRKQNQDNYIEKNNNNSNQQYNILYEKDNIKYITNYSKTSSSSDSDGNPPKENDIISTKYNPSLIKEPLRNLIINHNNKETENIELVENEGNGSLLYLSLSYRLYSNKQIRKYIGDSLNKRTEEMYMISIIINGNIPIKKYSLNAYKEEEWGDAEISMIQVVYDHIRVIVIN